MVVEHFLGVYGHVILDYIIEVQRLPEPNTSVQTESEKSFFGGTGANIARLAAKLSVSTSLASFVGREFPAEYRRALKESGVNISELRCIRRYSTPRAWIFSDPHGNQVAVVDQGPMRHAIDLPLLTKTAMRAEWVHFGTGRPEYYVKIARMAGNGGKMISLDPAQEIHYVYTPGTLSKMIKFADMFFGNQDEVNKAATMLKVEGARGLLSFVSTVVETKGSRGSLIHELDGTTEVPAITPRKLVDFTGAGDAFRAGFYAGLSRGFDFPHCAALGSSTASFTLEAKGTQTILPSYRQVLSRAKESGTF